MDVVEVLEEEKMVEVVVVVGDPMIQKEHV